MATETMKEAARRFLKRAVKATPFLTPCGLNNLPFSLYDAVIEVMADFASEPCHPDDHQWKGHINPSTPDGPAESACYCDVCGAEKTED